MNIQEIKSKITEVKVSIDELKDRFEMAELRNRELIEIIKIIQSQNYERSLTAARKKHHISYTE